MNENDRNPYNEPNVVKSVNDTPPLVLSILSLVFPGLVGMILGIISLVKVSKLSKDGYNTSKITASYVMGIIGIVLSGEESQVQPQITQIRF